MIGSGLGGSLGCGREGAYATYQAPDHFYKTTKASIKEVPRLAQGGGFAAGQLSQDASRRVQTGTAATGDIELDASTKGLGLLLQDVFGSTAVPVQQAATTAYLQTHTLGNNFGLSTTWQAGVPSRLGTVYPMTLLGGKVTAATFSCARGEVLKVALTIDGQQVNQSQTLSAPSFVTGFVPFHWADLSVKIGTFGAEAAVSGVRGVTWTIERPQQTDADYAGGAGLKDEPVGNDFVKVSGTIDIDFKTKADFVDRATQQTQVSVILDWKKSTAIASTYFPEFALATPATFFNPDTPSLESNDVVAPSIAFDVLSDDTHAIATATYQSTDSVI